MANCADRDLEVPPRSNRKTFLEAYAMKKADLMRKELKRVLKQAQKDLVPLQKSNHQNVKKIQIISRNLMKLKEIT